MMRSRVALALLAALLAVGGARADFFTSMADLQRLLQVEKDIPQVIDQYIAAENARLDELREQVFQLRRPPRRRRPLITQISA